MYNVYPFYFSVRGKRKNQLNIHNPSRPTPASLQHVRELNNRLDCMSKRLLEAQMVRDKYRGVVSSLRAEQMTYASRLQLMQRRLGEAASARAAVTRAERYAASVRESAQSQLSQSQQLSNDWRQERDAKLNEYK